MCTFPALECVGPVMRNSVQPKVTARATDQSRAPYAFLRRPNGGKELPMGWNPSFGRERETHAFWGLRGQRLLLLVFEAKFMLFSWLSRDANPFLVAL